MNMFWRTASIVGQAWRSCYVACMWVPCAWY